MRTILNNPIFINPLAYYVFPNLYGRLLPLVDSTYEPAIYVGDIEVRVIANGDTEQVRYFYNTDYIDFEGFFNTWIRISQHTVDGAIVLGEWKLGEGGEGKLELPEELKEALVGVWIADQNTNDSPTRNIIKNKLPNKGGDFEILNAAYKDNSGYGIITTDFLKYGKDYGTSEKIELTSTSFIVKDNDKYSLIFKYGNPSYADIESYEVDVVISNPGISAYIIRYWYYDEQGNRNVFPINKSGRFTVPKNYTSKGSTDTWIGWYVDARVVCSIKQVVKHQGAFVTDGVDDLIVSQKPVSEMLGGSNEFTIVSMWANLDDVKNRINVIRNIGTNYSQLYNNKPNIKGKCYIAGYSYSKGTFKIINDILGDKNDHIIQELDVVLSSPLSVEGYLNATTNNIHEVSEIAYYNTFLAKRVLTTDEINQVIAYYNLDKYVAPDIYYDVKKQGLTNENHAEFGDKLIDYSGNGRDMQLYNIGWEGMSGVNGYPAVFGANKTWEKTSSDYIIDYTANKCYITKVKKAGNGLFFSYVKENSTIKNIKEIPPFKIKVSGLEGKSKVFYRYLKTENAITSTILVLDNGIHELPKSFTPTNTLNDYTWIGFSITPIQDGVLEFDCNITIEVLPEYENSIVYDGATDYGQYVGDLGLKDYTVVADRAYTRVNNNQVPIISALDRGAATTPFTYEHVPGDETRVAPFSFGVSSNIPSLIGVDRKISYQSTYVYDKNAIVRGSSTNTGNGLTFGRYGDNYQYAALCLYSFMLFPYTLSEFLLERQLKKRNLGTLYPDMVEWRPVINADMSTIFNISFKLNDSKTISVGEYIPINSGVSIRIDLKKYQLDEVSLLKVNGQAIQIRKLGDYWKGDFTVTKSPQKIDITIDEYIRYEDIVMPYPTIVKIQDVNNKLYSWGDKIKVGTEIKHIGNTNLLPDLYIITGHTRLNGNAFTSANPTAIVEKQMVFSWSNKPRYKLGSNPPKVLLSPKRLSIPNSSYKILGYIPDISGHGNHGKLNNSAYAEGSGVNADGSYGLDGVDDFISIPTLSSGGKQVLMKVNWNNETSAMLYDQRTTYNNAFAIYVNGGTIAYNSLNVGGNTYIDGILNNSITCIALKDITHNITCLNSSELPSQSPKIGTNFGNSATFATMSLYTFMLFDEISTEEEIKELNEIVGIEGNTNDLFNPTN